MIFGKKSKSTTEYLSGLFLVREANLTLEITAGLVPSKLHSASECMCDFLPPDGAVVKALGMEEEYERDYPELGLSKEQRSDLEREICRLFESSKMGWSNVFFELEAARFIYRKFFFHLADVKLMGIGIQDVDRLNLLDDQADTGEKTEGVLLLLAGKYMLPQGGKQIGFEVLGYEWSSFHSFLCNSLQEDYSKDLGIKFNTCGLIDTYADASKACEYTINEELGEPVLWLPFSVYEYPL